MRSRHLLLLALTTMALLWGCSREEFQIGTSVDDAFHVKNGEYLIPVRVRGNTASGKIILFIQGGPGSNSLDFAEVDYPGWKATLEKDYAVAYYEQRGTGNSQGNFDLGENVTATYTGDLHAVSAFLQKAYDAEITQMGHSYGGGLMYEYMIRYGSGGIPAHYISLNGPATSDASADTLRWKFRREYLQNTALLEISRGRNVEQWQEVQAWLDANPKLTKLDGDDPYALYNQWNTYVEELVLPLFPLQNPTAGDYLHVLFLSPYNPFPAFLSGSQRGDLEDRIFGEEKSGYESGNQLMARLPQIDHQHLLLLTGRYDDVCPPEEMAYIQSQITSPHAERVVLEDAQHQSFMDQPKAFHIAIKQFLQ